MLWIASSRYSGLDFNFWPDWVKTFRVIWARVLPSLILPYAYPRSEVAGVWTLGNFSYFSYFSNFFKTTHVGAHYKGNFKVNMNFELLGGNWAKSAIRIFSNFFALI